ncbi:hypothetical protein CYMTET_18634 [Cymbomonas tetramitiformis]|uniref:Uncharacterized protein n=1 Tax=Cymbomonas tetramitiformis TaxID=36881 RepID=A0AAE0L5Q6_9CHLO|nr:hypothetical protein CYMTET_18634 [Cymbomonas tetramitiformis]
METFSTSSERPNRHGRPCKMGGGISVIAIDTNGDHDLHGRPPRRHGSISVEPMNVITVLDAGPGMRHACLHEISPTRDPGSSLSGRGSAAFLFPGGMLMPPPGMPVGRGPLRNAYAQSSRGSGSARITHHGLVHDSHPHTTELQRLTAALSGCPISDRELSEPSPRAPVDRIVMLAEALFRVSLTPPELLRH